MHPKQFCISAPKVVALESTIKQLMPLAVADNVLEKESEDSASLLVDEARDSLYATSTCKSLNGRLCNVKDGFMEALAVEFYFLSTEFAAINAFATTAVDLNSSRHL